MKYRLIRTNGPLIPGGFQFQDRITGKTYNDHHTRFDQRVREIIRDRQANARLWTDSKVVDTIAVAEELSEFNCARLKNNPLFCTDGLPKVNGPAAVQYIPERAPAGKVCRYCRGEEFEEVLCATCSGRKIIAYRCKRCRREDR